MTRARGYTLIELVVALAVLALCSVLIAQALRLGMRAWATVDARTSRAEAVAAVQQLLRGRLSQAYPYKVAAGAHPYALLGQADELTFSAPGPHALAGQMLRYRVYWRRGDGTGELRIAWQPDHGPGTPRNAEQSFTEESLLDDVADAGFEYFAQGEHQQGHWVSSWNNSAGLPQLVRLSLQFAHGERDAWPVLVVRPRIAIPADCGFDLVSRQCR